MSSAHRPVINIRLTEFYWKKMQMTNEMSMKFFKFLVKGEKYREFFTNVIYLFVYCVPYIPQNICRYSNIN